MKTSIFTLLLFLLNLNIYSQNYTIVCLVSNKNYAKYKTITPPKALSYLSFTNEVYKTVNFKYREFLNNSKQSKKIYQIGLKGYSKKELTKIFRKSARQSESLNEFKMYLKKEHILFTSKISNNKLKTLYNTFREGTLHKYIDDLHSAI